MFIEHKGSVVETEYNYSLKYGLKMDVEHKQNFEI